MKYYYLTGSERHWLEELYCERGGVARDEKPLRVRDGTNHLFIGLGGLGGSTLARLKELIESRVGGQWQRHVRFLYLDTDQQSVYRAINAGTLSENEALLLRGEGVSQWLNVPENMCPPYLNRILPPASAGFRPMPMERCGAGQIRLMGRLALLGLGDFDGAVAKIQTAISGLECFNSRKLEVHIIAGLGGGTGSALAVDIPYLVRREAAALQLPQEYLTVCGHCYLPEVFADCPAVNMDRLQANTYAALKEINHFMHTGSNFEYFETLYPDGAYSSHHRIYDTCTLIGRYVLGQTRETAMDNCAQSLLTRMAGGIGVGNVVMDQQLSWEYLLGGQGIAPGVIDWDNIGLPENGDHSCSYVGTCRLDFPRKAISEYMAGECFAKIFRKLEKNEKQVDQARINAFADYFAPNRLIQESLNVFQAEAHQYLMEDDRITKDAIRCDKPMWALMQMVDRIASRYNFDSIPILKSCDTLCREAEVIFRDPERGPCYLSRLLTAAYDIGDPVQGVFARLKEFSHMCRSMADQLNQELQKSMILLQEMKEWMLAPFRFVRRNRESYAQKLLEYCLWQLQLRLVTKLDEEIYLQIGRHLRQQLGQKLVRGGEILAEASRILEENALANRNVVFGQPEPCNILSIEDPVINGLQACVLETIENALQRFDGQDGTAFAAELLDEMVAKPDAWILEQGRFAESLRRFILDFDSLKVIADRDLAGWLAATPQAQDPAAMNRMLSRILECLRVRAVPLVNTIPGFYWTKARDLGSFLLRVPGGLLGQMNAMMPALCVCGESNAFSLECRYMGLPVWLPAGMERYEQAYLHSTEPGMHLNESIQTDPTWRAWPSLIPGR